MKKPSEIIKTIELSRIGIEFLPTGFHKLDDALDGGFMRKELLILGGYSGVGKSYVASQIMWNLANEGFNCAYFSLEISNQMIVSRILGAESNIKPTRIISGLLSPDEYENLKTAKAKVITHDQFLNFYDDIYDYHAIEKEIRDNKYEFFVLDFIQNVIAPGADEYSRLTFVSLSLQRLTKETNSCGLILSQLSNAAARSGLMEYKGSGSIITVCDLGLFLKRGEASNNSNQFEISIRKNRRGFSGQSFEFVFKHPGGKIL